MIRDICICLLICLLIFGLCWAASMQADKIIIDAEEFEMLGKTNDILARKGVKVVQGDVIVQGEEAVYRKTENIIYLTGKVTLQKGKIIIHANKVDVYGDQKQIVAYDEVSFSYDELKGRSDRITYNLNEQKLDLTGNPRAWERDNEINGKDITVYLNDKRIISQGKTRVIIAPDSIR